MLVFIFFGFSVTRAPKNLILPLGQTMQATADSGGAIARFTENRDGTCTSPSISRALLIHLISRQMPAANNPPIIGANQNSHSWFKDVPPTINAGSKLLAGLTDVPVIGIPTKCVRTRLNPMEKSVACFFLSFMNNRSINPAHFIHNT